MKLNTLIRSALVGAALSATTLFANTVKLSHTAFNGNPSAGAGEFWADTDNNGDFLTFCIEKNKFVTVGTTYNYTIDSAALDSGNVLSEGSAYLYKKFRTSSLVGPAGGGGTYLSDRDVNAGHLQNAFWMLEGGLAYNSSNFYVNLVESLFGGMAGATANVTSNYGVKVMNLWEYNANGAREDKQSQLVLVPDTGMTVALLGLGLLSLAAFRRKL
jgi:hypothetical protein